jgi:mono/diheme cytochrome c family protein
MNTSKQVNIMIGLLFLSFVVFGAYIAWEPTRSSDAEDNQAELFADRGAMLFINNCRGCHGMEGEGHIAPALATNAFLILGEDNEFGLEPTADGEADGIRGFLHNTISCGRTGSFMPVWAQEQGGALSRIQIDYLVELITSGRWDIVAKDALHHDLEVNELAPKTDIVERLESGEITSEEATAEWVAAGITDGGIFVAEEDGLLSDEQLQEIFSAQALVSAADVPSLSITTSNCGQYNAATLTEFRNRDPLVAPPPTDGTAEPTATSTPDGGGGPEDAVVQGLPVRDFFAQNCASCHGQERQGIVGPALTRDRLTQPDDFYIDTISNGRAGTVMPAWSDAGLTDEEITSIVTWLKNTDP